MKKSLFIVLALAVMGISVYLYIEFNGIPWKKQAVSEELEVFIEEKYEMNITLKEAFYNFKDGSYGAVFVTDSNPNVSFNAEKYRNETYSDYYIENLWLEEAKADIEPILAESFPSLSLETYQINPVYGTGVALVKGKEVPSYKEIETGIDLGIHFQNDWTKETEETLVKEAYEFIVRLKEKGVDYLGVRLYLKEKELADKRTQSFAVSIEGKDFGKIQSEEDLEKYTTIF